jgi:hypothetical protein
MLRGVGWSLIADVSGQHYGLTCLILEDGTDILSRNFCNQVATCAALHTTAKTSDYCFFPAGCPVHSNPVPINCFYDTTI